MKRHTDWMNEDDLFNEITNALQSAGIDADARDEEGPYRERGTITIRTADGRSFALEIHELSS
jgi:hypothetical protein